MSSVIGGRGGRKGGGAPFIKITVDEDEAVKAMAVAEELTSPQYFSFFLRTNVVDHFQKRVEARFSTEGDDASGKWKPLQESTINIRESEGVGPGPILERHGDLKRDMVNARGQAYMVPGGAELQWPSTSDLRSRQVPEKLMVAQRGSPPQGGHGPTPARPVAAISGRDTRMIVDLLSVQLKFSLERGMNVHLAAL